MANKQVIYSDRLVGIAVHNGTARLDFGVVAGTAKDKDGKAGVKVEVTHQLVLPLDAFAQAASMQDKLLKELVAREKKRRESKKGAEAAKVEGSTNG